MGRVMVSTIRGLQTDPKNIEDIISESVLNEQPALDRFRSALSVFAAVAPLLGLLGTVTGMITTFDVITQYGTGDPQLLSGGISEALITTEFGLAVAIPTLLIGNLLSSWSDRITSNIEVSALRAANISGGYEGAQRA
jgi:biopolymer transport protein ExbB